MAKRKSKITETIETRDKPIESPNIKQLDLAVRLDKLEQRFENLKVALIKSRRIENV